MKSYATTVKQYLAELPEDRKAAMTILRDTIKKNIPNGFEECISYGMIGYVVPHSIYPKGYHCDPKLPLPFANIASQKNFISLYHMGLYNTPTLLNWFVTAYEKIVPTKLDMGKGCVRFKKMDNIPFQLIGELMQKITVKEHIEKMETYIK